MGNFSNVRVGGINGALSLVWSLGMWLNRIEGGWTIENGGQEEWLEAVRDVAWVLRP